MHISVLEFLNYAVKEYQLAHSSVLEVGSRDINGSPRKFFDGVYWGVDMIDGPGVDEVCNAHDLMNHEGPPELDREPEDVCPIYDVVVSTEMFEHDSAPWESMNEMRHVCRAGGYLIVTARGYDHRGCFPVHGYPEDHWRYSVTGMEHLLHAFCWEPIEVRPDHTDPGVFAVARAR